MPSNFPTVIESYMVAFNANIGVLIKIGCSVETWCLQMPQFLDFVKARLSSFYSRAEIGNGQVKTVQCSWSLMDPSGFNLQVAFTSVTVTCISLCKKYRKWVFPMGNPYWYRFKHYQPTRFRLVFSCTLRNFSV